MSILAILQMAIHNMRRRMFRTILNLLGIALGTTIVLMTVGGTAGVKDALNSLFENSDLTRKVIVRRAPKFDESMLEESDWKITAPMTDRRRIRMENALKEYLLDELNRKSGRFHRINRETIKKIEAVEHTTDVIPRVSLRFKLQQDDFSTQTYVEGVSPGSVGLKERIVAGQMLQPGDTQCVLVHELLAFQMGFTSTDDLKQLVGKTIDVTFAQSSQGNKLAALLSAKSSGSEKKEILQALGAMVENLGLSNLTQEQQRVLLDRLKPAVDQGDEAQTVKRNFVIKGVYHSLEDDLFSIFDQFTFDSSRPVLFHNKTATDLQAGVFAKDDFYTATVLVDSYRDIDSVSREIEQMGFKTVSVKRLLKTVQHRIDQISRVIYIVASVILLMTLFAISNTLIISVMERTSEFGIMKSLGAKDRHIVSLMLVEGALLGLIGSAIAIGTSLLLAKFGQNWVRDRIEDRINQVISNDVFALSINSLIIAAVSAVLVCCLASIIPAWRAARLDPIVAMQRK